MGLRCFFNEIVIFLQNMVEKWTVAMATVMPNIKILIGKDAFWNKTKSHKIWAQTDKPFSSY